MSVICEEINFDQLPGGTEIDSLKKIIENNNLVNCTVEITEGSQKGDNYVGIIHKATVDGRDKHTDAPKQLQLIIKTSSRLDPFRELFKAYAMFAREIFMYETVLPTFQTLQVSKKVDKIFNSYPKMYETCVADKDEFLIMEDVKSLGFVMKDRRVPLDFEHCKFVLMELGRYHSLSFALKKHQPDIFRYYVEKVKHFMYDVSDSDIESFGKHQDRMMQKAVDSLDPEKDVKEIEAFKKFSEMVNEYTLPVMRGETIDQYAIISHGDCWSNNILYKYEDSEAPDKPTEVCFLDWQISFYTSPAIDLSYFIYNCISPESLKNHFDELIRIYHDSLSSSLKEMDCNPEELFPFSALQDHIKKHFNFGVVMACTLIHLFTSEKDEIPDFSGIKDLSEEEMAIWDFKSKNIDLYNMRMSAVIRHAVKNGFL